MKRIALVTTSRAEYGIQSRLIRMLQDDPDIDFRLVVSGTHLSEKHGMTWRQIEADGIVISEKVDIGIDNTESVPYIMAVALEKFADILASIKPDIVVLLGDRYEMLSVALACTLNNIPIAHIHGGETTEGAVDEVFRHSITKAAYLHFTSCEEYRRRVIQLGEAPNRVFNVESLGVENISHIDFIGKRELADTLGIIFSPRNFLVTFHPVTMEERTASEQTKELLSALEMLDNSTIVFTHPNADREGDVIAGLIESFVSKHPKTYLFKSLGIRRYFSLMKFVNAVIGNSSSGIIETPSLGVPTVNIGDRQKGRMQAPSIINCAPICSDISKAIQEAESLDFRNICSKAVNPYAKDGTANQILYELKRNDLSVGLKKEFFDVDFSL